LRVLETIGLKVESEKARKFLEEAGAKFDHKTTLVKFPSTLIEESIKKAPERFLEAVRKDRVKLIGMSALHAASGVEKARKLLALLKIGT